MRRWIVLLALGLLVPGTACRKKEAPPPPSLTTEMSVVTPDGEPIAGVAVQAQGQPKGETDAEGKLSFQFSADPGDELALSATLDQPGLKFAPWSQQLVVRKFDPARPETMRYPVDVVLQPVELSAPVRVEGDAGPIAGAAVSVQGKLKKTDDAGQVQVELGKQLKGTREVAVQLKGYEPWKQKVDLQAGKIFVVSLSKIGAIYGTITAAYEQMGRLVPVPQAKVTVGGSAVGVTSDKGTVRYQVPTRRASAEVRRDGYAPDPATLPVPAGSSARLVVPLVPRSAPRYRVALLPPENGSPGDGEIEAVLPEVADKLADYVFANACFERADGPQSADVVISSLASRVPSGLLLSVKMTAGGKQIAGFAEDGGLGRVRSLCDTVATKIRDTFPFEGHVIGFSEDRARAVVSLGAGGGRGVRRGDTVVFYKWTPTTPPKVTRTGKGSVKRADDASSQVEVASGTPLPAIGDKVVLAPKAQEAAFGASVTLTVKAGREGNESPFADVSVYRDGTWVGTTAANGVLRVAVAPGEKHTFIFVRSGVKPYEQPIQVEAGASEQTVLLPNAVCHLKLESEPTGAKVLVDGQSEGSTPLETDVVMGFHRVQVDAGGDWRTFDEVIEFSSAEKEMTGSRRVILMQDVLKLATRLVEADKVDQAIAMLVATKRDHPDYSGAHHLAAGLYLDRKNDAARAISEYDMVLALPQNRELVNKRFAVTFLNLGRAHYLLGTPQAYREAIRNLEIARANKRFFPKEQHDRALHDTLYFMALATQKLYHAEDSPKLLRDSSRYWKDYFDFFPASLADDAEVQAARKGAEQYYEEIKRKLVE